MSRVPDLIVERVHLGEASSEQRARVMADPDARARLEALEEADSAFLSAHPPDVLVPDLERRVHVARTRDASAARQRSWRNLSVLMMPVLAAGMAFVVLGGGAGVEEGMESVIHPTDGVIGLKGAETPKFYVYRQVRGQTKRMQNGTVLLRGDRLQLGYKTVDDTPVHGVMVSIDGRGEVTVHAPDGENTLMPQGRHMLPHAYELDDAPNFERFFFVTSGQPISVDRVVRAAENLAGSEDVQQAELPLGGDLDQQDLLILKAGAR
ncbi:MAG: hypothetical protein KTR31_35830 [Myxococcales bacterium]|nr:hypothetical protein [Myxococcales bacterium]